MFAICHLTDSPDNLFVMYDKTDMKDISKHMGIVVKENITLADVFNKYSDYPIMSCNDLIIRIMNNKRRTDIKILDELNINTLVKIKQEYDLIEAKASKLSRSERERVQSVYHTIQSMDQSDPKSEEKDQSD